MKKNKINLFYKILCFVLVFVLTFSCFCISSSAESNSWQTADLTDFFVSKTTGQLQFFNEQLLNSFYSQLYGIGYFILKPLEEDSPYKYNVVSNFKNSFYFESDKYYTLAFPLSFSTNYLNLQTAKLSFFDSNHQEYKFDLVNQIWPDPKASTTNNGQAQYVTYYFQGTFKGALLVEMDYFQLSFSGNNWSGYGLSYGGLLQGNYISITEITKSEYESIYGDPNTDYNQPSSEPQDKLHGLEDELINDDGLNSIGDFFSDSGNGGNSIVNISNGLQAAGLLFAELFNFNGKRYTIFNMLINFSLTLGMVCFLLNLAPKVFGGSSRSKNKNNKGSKGGKSK